MGDGGWRAGRSRGISGKERERERERGGVGVVSKAVDVVREGISLRELGRVVGWEASSRR